MVGLAGALVLNIGTLSEDWIEAMLLAGAAANERAIPVVLDPVGAGATRVPHQHREADPRRRRRGRPARERGRGRDARRGRGGGARRRVGRRRRRPGRARPRRPRGRSASSRPSPARSTMSPTASAPPRSRTGTSCSRRSRAPAACRPRSPAAFSPARTTRSRRPSRRWSPSESPGRTRPREAKGPGSFHVALYDALAALDPELADRTREGLVRVHALVSDAESAPRRRGRRRDRRAAAPEGCPDRTDRRARPCPARSRGRARRQRRPRRRARARLRRPPRPDRPRHRARPRSGHARSESPSPSGARLRSRSSPGATYLGAGPIWETPSKPDAGVPIGLDGLRDVCLSVSIPVVAIGGIDASNAADCIRAGAAGVAVIRAVAEIEALRAAVDAAL